MRARTVDTISDELHEIGREIEAAEAASAALYARRVLLYTEAHFDHQMTYDAIATATGVSFGSVAQALRKIKKGT